MLSPSRVFTRIYLVKCCYLTPGGVLGITAESGAGMAVLEACELLSRLMLACSRAMTLTRKKDRPRKLSFNEQVFVVLARGSVNGGTTGSRISCISFQKVDTGM